MPGSLYFPDQREEWSAENRDDPETGGSGVRVFFLWEEEDARGSAGASLSRKRMPAAQQEPRPPRGNHRARRFTLSPLSLPCGISRTNLIAHQFVLFPQV